MAIKDLWTQTNKWLEAHKLTSSGNSQPEVDDEGLISQDSETPGTADAQTGSAAQQSDNVVVQAVPQIDKNESIEKLQQGVGKLAEQLADINEHLGRQVTQHEELIGRIEQLPKLVESFPSVVESQKKLTEQLIEQLKSAAAKNHQFLDAVEKIPHETAKQTDALVDIDHQLAAAADTDVQMTESFNKFNQTLDKLNQSTLSQTDSIMQMSRTFSTSDRYLKYIVSRQNKRFIWVFIISLSVCVVVILILVGIILYLKS
jgi:tetrahydromethanopterin S-methyltransferase subunit B